MARVALTDSNGVWFDTDKAIKFSEDTWWNGNNHISSATGSQWEHQALYYTKSGRWVLNSWSAYQGVRETYEEVNEAYAVDWLIAQERFEDEGLAKLPPAIREQVKQAIDSAEI